MVSSACHGVEGYCGSGVQVFALHDAEWRAKARDAGVAVLYIHALNPYGFSHSARHARKRRSQPQLPFLHRALAGQRCLPRVAPLLLPDVWPPNAANVQAVANLHCRARRVRLAGRHHRGAA